MSSEVYCPYRQASLLQQALSSDKMRVAFLLGAGCPVSIRVPDGADTKPLIPDIAGLTSAVRSKIESDGTQKVRFEKVLKRLHDSGKPTPNIEDYLSFIRALSDVAAGGNIDGLSKEDLDSLDSEICKITTSFVNVELPAEDNPYRHLSNWIRGIKRASPIELFTPNYDLLMEQALEEMNVPYFDGFVGSKKTFFDLPSIEQDILPARWSRLWKLHGSINWWRTSDGRVERRYEGSADDRQMIYPSHLKYDQSRRMPYLAMLDRLKTFLAKGQSVLITCGYSFVDQHLNEIILQGLNGNPLSACFGLLYGDRSLLPHEALTQIKSQPNLSLLAADGAIIGTISCDWHEKENPDHPLHNIAISMDKMEGRTVAPESRCKFTLGDYKSLGMFLARQLSFGREDMETPDA